MEPIRAQMRANAYRGDHEVLQNLAPLLFPVHIPDCFFPALCFYSFLDVFALNFCCQDCHTS